MTAAQIVLLLSLVLLALYTLLLRTATTDRFMMMAVAALGVVFVLWPDLTTRIAAALGIGRGADLLLYLFVVLSLFFFVHVLSELGRQTRMITAIAREMALMNARQGGLLDHGRQGGKQEGRDLVDAG